MKDLKPNDLVVYIPDYAKTDISLHRPGIIKRLDEDGVHAFVWYHEGCTAARTKLKDLVKAGCDKNHKHIHKGCSECIPNSAKTILNDFGLFEKEFASKSNEGTQFLLDNKIWLTQSFEMLPISDMTTDHIHNCLNLIVVNHWRTAWHPLFIEELKRRRSK